MRQTGTRGARARRRAAKQPVVEVPTPSGWPDADTLIEALDVNALAARLLDEMKPESMRTALQRMDPKQRKMLLEPRNIPTAKVSLRSAGQVLNLARAEDKPAEGELLGTLLSPAGTLFHEAKIPTSVQMALRLKLIDLALPLVVSSESAFQGLRIWHRWCDASFEDLTMAAVIGRRCSHAALAASFLAVSHPDIDERYHRLMERFPLMPRVPFARLTVSNPISRYLAARPDRKLPSNAAELRRMLQEDATVRDSETQQSEREGVKTPSWYDEPETTEPVAPREPERPQPEPAPPALPAPHDPRDTLPALPDVTEWAKAVTYSRSLAEALVAGRLPDVAHTQALLDLTIRVRNLATLCSRVLGRRVEADRFAVDRALTEILADSRLSDRLGGMPATAADVAAALRRLPALDNDAESAPEQPVSSAPAPAENELSDLDNMLRGETGAQLTAIAAHSRPSTEDADPDPADGSDDVTDDRPAAESPGRPTAPVSPRAWQAVSRMVAIAFNARHPGGPLATEYARIVSELDLATLEEDRTTRTLALCTAMPMALIDASCGAGPLLHAELPELAGCRNVMALRDAITELSRHGISVYDPAVRELTTVMSRFDAIRDRAARLREQAETRTLKYDKATKVYRGWLAPQGRLRPLVDALASGDNAQRVSELAAEAGKAGAKRAIDDTVAEEFGPGRVRIVAGARQALTDIYDEVLGIAADNSSTMEIAAGLHAADRSAAWRFEQVARFRDQIHHDLKAVEAELESPQCPHPVVYGMVLRAMATGLNPLPPYGPEIDLETATRRAFPRRDARARS